jgi:HEAT repeat protein
VFVLVSFLASLGADSILTETEAIRRIQAHLIIKDPISAYQEAQCAFTLYPHSAHIHEIFIRTLARLGNEKEMLKVWDEYVAKFSNNGFKREIIEEMSWGVLNKASSSSSLVIRLMGLLAAFFSQDVKGVKMLQQGLHDPNATVRAVAVQLASHLRDTVLKDEMKRLFREETNWVVRKELIPAIGSMKILELHSQLEGLIASDRSLAEEKSLAIEALIELLDEIKREEMVRLASSNRSGLRLLACEAIAYFGSNRDQDLLVGLVNDHHSDVRAAALQGLGRLTQLQDQDKILALANTCLNDRSPVVALSAAWLMTLYHSDKGREVFVRYLSHDQREVRWLAAAALGATGGCSLAQQLLKTHFDEYVRLNLALSLIDHRLSVLQAAEVIDQTMRSKKEQWQWSEWGLFKAITPRFSSQLAQDSTVSTPEMENQLIRLELLNLLAIVKAPRTQESIRQFLSERTWGITGTASAMLLTEGDDMAIDLVHGLLQDPHPKVRVQAALVLSLWGRDEQVIQILEQAYWSADKEMKEKILEGLARIGAIRSVPFLISVLKEPSQTLRLIAATALICCLNH